MRPNNLKTRIFLDSGDPDETREAIKLLGFLDGQTTNPSLIAKNPQTKGKKFSQTEVFEFYRNVVGEVSALIPEGSVSIEVYADDKTTTEAMLGQGLEFFEWIPNAHIKFPTTTAGLKAAEVAVKEGMRVNMTLCFSQAQAAAVYAATRGAVKGQVYVSPFVGRLDDIGQNGMDAVKNILAMYKQGDGHVAVLTASVRNLNHFLYALALGSDIITAPLKTIKEWVEAGFEIPTMGFKYGPDGLKAIPYETLDLNENWTKFDLIHQLTEKGIEKFSQDWNALIK
jgi:transaldolase